ncbi:MAG TPA: Xaa-Pro peptidase family protein [Candidatus Acidoferrales bacterium]|nr:Xaa-Pro peptidase family protein [Candidatus Acidoferrales bacterium]
MLYNKERLHALMDRFGLEAMVAATPENIFYLSGFTSWSQGAYKYGNSQSYVVYPRDPNKSPALLTGGGEAGYAALEQVWLKEVYTFGRARRPHIDGASRLCAEEERVIAIQSARPLGGGPEEALAQLLKEKGFARSAIGIDHLGMTMKSYDTVRALLPQAELRLASNLMRYARMIKTAQEIGRLREAAAMNDRALTVLLQNARPGVCEGELIGIYRAEVAKAGGQVYWNHFSASRGGNMPPLPDRRLRKGDIVRMDMGCSLRGYHADTCRSGRVAEDPDKAHRKRYDAVRQGVLRSVEAVKPGAVPSKLYETMIAGVRAAGIPNYANFFVGHTIGLEAREFPFISGPAEKVDDPFLPETTDIPLEAGMTINLEASYHEFGWGAVHVEYTLAVTENGSEYLSAPEQQQLYVLPLS